MKWTTAMCNVRELAETCDEMRDRTPDFYRIHVRQLWTFGAIFGAATEIEWIPVALAIDLPPEEVPWLSEPLGTEHWANATRLSKKPFTTRWRSADAPVWNHEIERPALVWDAENGLAEETIEALREHDAERVRVPGPSPEELRARIDDEVAICLDSVRRATATYGEKRWKPGKLTPLADALWLANDGYLDLLNAQRG